MKIVYHDDFNQVYTADPAAAAGRISAVFDVIYHHAAFVPAKPASREDIARCHTDAHIDHVRRQGLYDIAALAAGAACQAAHIAITEPSFALIRPPGHHASADGAWGFCYFNNMAIALSKLKHEGVITSALVLDIDLHYGDGTVNILGQSPWVTIVNPSATDRKLYVKEVESSLPEDVDMIGISAGFDNHESDWGGLLTTDDYREIGRMVRNTRKEEKGCFAILEGGYNHDVLGHNVKALIDGLEPVGSSSYEW